MSDPELSVAPMDNVHTHTPQLPDELWQEVFFIASSIPSKDELSMDVRAHSRVPLVPGMRSAIINEKELGAALKVRWSTVLVCKQWYNIAIPLLYQHVRINRHLKDYGPDSALAGDCARHMHHTTRLTIASQLRFEVSPPLYIQPSEVLARICKNLPNLQILNSPSELLPQLQQDGIFPLLKIAECTGYRTTMPALSVRSTFQNVWTNLRFLSFPTDFMSVPLNKNEVFVFPSVQHLCIVNSFYGEGGVNSAEYISRYWLMPQLHTFSATLMTWQSICRFCERHTATLRVVILHSMEDFRYSPLPLHTTPSVLPLSRLEEFYGDDIRLIKFSPLKHAKIVGVHSLGPRNIREHISWCSNPTPFQARLMIALILWVDHSQVFKCFISGVDYALDWFKTQLPVVEALSQLAAKGSVVEFLPMIPDFI